MSARTDIVRLRITLDEVKAPIMRRVTVRLGIRLDRLHSVIQAAMGWTDSHLWEFRIDGIGWGIPDPDWPDGPFDARKATLASVLAESGSRSLDYIYDFGDGWNHRITVEGVFPAVAGIKIPFLLEAVGRCPPEDVGGPPGYEEFLAAIADPDHERYSEFAELFDMDFDPNAVDVASIQNRLATLAKR